MRIASLGSGSRGNATLIADGDQCFLVDCGFSLKDLTQRADRIGFSLDRLTAVFVTHEHSDHVSGVAALARRYDLPVFLTHGTYASGRIDGRFDARPYNADSDFSVGGVQVRAVAVPHDAREPVQYVFFGAAGSIGILTDLGSVTPHVVAAFEGCDLLVLEFNHDRDMLLRGPYPPTLKRRVGGAWGHLSNDQAAAFLQQVVTSKLKRLFIAHTSEKNNDRDRILSAISQQCPEILSRVTWACQTDGFTWFDLEATSPPFGTL